MTNNTSSPSFASFDIALASMCEKYVLIWLTIQNCYREYGDWIAIQMSRFQHVDTVLDFES